jgi:tRNA-dihydrouridine synthase C
VVANGEIWTIDDLRQCRDETGCQHFMLGRGLLADPTLGRSAARELGIPGVCSLPSFARTPAEWLSLISRYRQLCIVSRMSPIYILSRVKQWLRMANHGGNLAWFDALKSCQDLGELLHNLSARADSLRRCQRNAVEAHHDDMSKVKLRRNR